MVNERRKYGNDNLGLYRLSDLLQNGVSPHGRVTRNTPKTAPREQFQYFNLIRLMPSFDEYILLQARQNLDALLSVQVAPARSSQTISPRTVTVRFGETKLRIHCQMIS